MKWTDMVVVLAFIALVGWIGNGIISCTQNYMVEDRTAYTNYPIEFPMDTEALEEEGYFEKGR